MACFSAPSGAGAREGAGLPGPAAVPGFGSCLRQRTDTRHRADYTRGDFTIPQLAYFLSGLLFSSTGAAGCGHWGAAPGAAQGAALFLLEHEVPGASPHVFTVLSCPHPFFHVIFEVGIATSFQLGIWPQSSTGVTWLPEAGSGALKLGSARHTGGRQAF